jgi:nucleotide-binding universal stress UspA family protein
MRRVLVPLDGTQPAASILSEAARLAGEGGEIILIRDPIGMVPTHTVSDQAREEAVRDALSSLESAAAPLRRNGLRVETHASAMIEPAQAIDVAARIYRADMVACTTTGAKPLGGALRGGVLWRALANSPVPVLVQHSDTPGSAPSTRGRELRILVPLDGSELAERALPLAGQLAHEWDAQIWLAHVVSSYPISGLPRTDIDPKAETDEGARQAAVRYLDGIATRLPGTTNSRVLFGSAAEQLNTAVSGWGITHVVMSSHGRTGLARMIMGSVADDLIRLLTCPVIVVPSHASAAPEDARDPTAR